MTNVRKLFVLGTSGTALLVLLALAAQPAPVAAGWFSADYYDLLGVSSSATKDEIKRAYRKLSKEKHPDKIKRTATEDERTRWEEDYMKITEAYQTLSNDRRRKMYDTYSPLTSNWNKFASADEEVFGESKWAMVVVTTLVVYVSTSCCISCGYWYFSFLYRNRQWVTWFWSITTLLVLSNFFEFIVVGLAETDWDKE